MKKNNAFISAYGLIGATLYCIPVIVFMRTTDFANQWLLFTGNFLLLGLVFFAVLQFNKTIAGDPPLFSMIGTGMKITLITIAISCVMLLVFAVFDQHKILNHASGESFNGKKNGLWVNLFLDATLGNIFLGSFSSVIASISVKKDPN